VEDMMTEAQEVKILLTDSEICKRCRYYGEHGEYHGKRWNKCQKNLEKYKLVNHCTEFMHK
jgi:hypothetical protein